MFFSHQLKRGPCKPSPASLIFSYRKSSSCSLHWLRWREKLPWDSNTERYSSSSRRPAKKQTVNKDTKTANKFRKKENGNYNTAEENDRVITFRRGSAWRMSWRTTLRSAAQLAKMFVWNNKNFDSRYAVYRYTRLTLPLLGWISALG